MDRLPQDPQFAFPYDPYISFPKVILFSSATISQSDDSKERCFEYNWIDGAETLEKYKPGGYHPIMFGDVLHSRYRIVDKLGYGGYSTIWLARDACSNRYFAVKVGIAGSGRC